VFLPERSKSSSINLPAALAALALAVPMLVQTPEAAPGPLTFRTAQINDNVSKENAMTSMKWGDFYRVEFPTGGSHAQSDRRTAIVIQIISAQIGTLSASALRAVWQAFDSITSST
jgi:hypothetical protein